MISSIAIALLGAIVGTYMFLRALLHFSQDAREPQAIENAIPFISPILSMAAKKANFYSLMRDRYNLPLYSLRMPGSRIYVVNSTSLIPVVQRQFRTLSFTALESKLARDVMGVSKNTHEIISRDNTRDEGYLMTFPKYIHPAVSAGLGLDAMNRRLVEVLAESLDVWVKRGPTTVNMFQWIRHELVIATTEGVYGPKNPFRNSAMEEAWYKIESGIMMFLLKLWPKIFANESFQAREYMGKGSKLIQCRVQINNTFNIPLKQTAKMEEVDGTCTIDLADVKGFCPVLLSTFKEMFRYNSAGVSARITMEDHMLDNKYLIKKGSTVMIPSRVQHTTPSIWGETVDEFNHKRFMRQPGVKQPTPIAFRGFGGGTTLCPGRHFVSTEVLMFSALLARPTTGRSPLVAAIPVPDWDIDIKICPRDDKKWVVSFSGHDRDMEISAEDVGGTVTD
ncbi:cytochrome P450 [Hypoxylon sp. FL1150]|nr:cytochrome P450 [Hypoxylon sp. FL1150]